VIEIVVAGGGLAGAAVAIELAARGAAVNLIEAERPGSAATGASAGMLAPQYESAGPGPLYRVLLQSRAWYPQFIESIRHLSDREIDVRWDGMLVANADEAEAAGAAAMAEWQHAEGQRCEVVSVDHALTLQPGIATDIHSYLWLPDEGQVEAQQLAAVLGAALSAAGVRVIAGQRVASVVIEGIAATGVALEDGRVISADAVVIAAGAWSDRITGLPRSLGVRPVRGHMLRFAAGAATVQRLVASHAAQYLVPRNDGTILAGSTMEETGYDRSMDDDSLRAVHRAAAALLPALRSAKPSEQWADLRPISADSLPVLGADPDVSGLYYATGYGRNGILLAPLAANVLAGVLLEGRCPEPWQWFTPARFPAR
jgi:glycine oxidase